MKTTNLRFVLLLTLSTLMGCALGQSATRDAGTATAGRSVATGLLAQASSASARHATERLQ